MAWAGGTNFWSRCWDESVHLSDLQLALRKWEW